MSDDEKIEKLNSLHDVAVTSCLLVEEYTELLNAIPDVIALARIGAAVKPRPIEEAPKDGEWLLGWESDNRCEMRPFAWNKAKKAWCDLPDGDRFEGFSPTHFIPLSALPKPESPQPGSDR